MREERRRVAVVEALEGKGGALPLDRQREPPIPQRPLPKPRASDRIRAALMRWLEEDL